MDIVFICRNAEENSVLTNVAMAMDAAKEGQSTAVLFTEDALAALAGQAFEWAPAFRERSGRAMVTRQATTMGYPLAKESDPRWTDVRRLLKAAKDGGVSLWGCSLWSQLLGLNGAGGSGGPARAARPNEVPFVVKPLPDEITTLPSGQVLRELQSAKTVIGGF